MSRVPIIAYTVENNHLKVIPDALNLQWGYMKTTSLQGFEVANINDACRSMLKAKIYAKPLEERKDETVLKQAARTRFSFGHYTSYEEMFIVEFPPLLLATRRNHDPYILTSHDMVHWQPFIIPHIPYTGNLKGCLGQGDFALDTSNIVLNLTSYDMTYVLGDEFDFWEVDTPVPKIHEDRMSIYLTKSSTLMWESSWRLLEVMRKWESLSLEGVLGIIERRYKTLLERCEKNAKNQLERENARKRYLEAHGER